VKLPCEDNSHVEHKLIVSKVQRVSKTLIEINRDVARGRALSAVMGYVISCSRILSIIVALCVMLCVIKPPLTDITTALDELSQDNAEAKLDQALTQLAGYVKKGDLSTRFSRGDARTR